jgi:hypothetical protein
MSLEKAVESAISLFETGKRFYVSTETADHEMARECFEKAAGLGYAPAQRLLGIMYLDGKDAPLNYELAREWLTLAADRGDPLATFKLAQIYAYAMGVEKDWSKAYGLLTLQGMEAIPEALELKTRLKSEIVRHYPNLIAALEKEEDKVRRSLTRDQHRFIPNFFGPARSENDFLEFSIWLALNLGRVSAQQAFSELSNQMNSYYRNMTKVYPTVTAG